ncbi:hypothetical protein NKH94_30595 [Mesorhizobium australicum]
MLFSGYRLLSVHPVGSLLRLAGGGENGAGIVFQQRRATRRYTLHGRHADDGRCSRSARISPLRISTQHSVVLRHIHVASKHELKTRIMAGIDEVNRHPVVHT